MSDPTPTCIVHLVRAANGPVPFGDFLTALRAHPPGTDFELVLAMKGFADRETARPYLELARELAPRALFFSDEGLDIGVYFRAAAELQRARYCFLNSYSEPPVSGWLARLEQALAQSGTGLAGASGSWASARSWTLHALGLPSAYRGVLPPRAIARAQFLALEEEVAQGPARRPRLARLRALPGLAEALLCYQGFPAQHMRTNAFMVSHEVLERLRVPAVDAKRDAYRFEHGRRGLTRQVQGLGLRTVVVDRDGLAHEPARWYLSRTFWQGEQEALLVADNQTRRYERGDADRRRLLARFAWGSKAEPVGGAQPVPESSLA